MVRKRGALRAGPKDGERVESLREEAHDQGLEDDRVYHYAIYALYRMPDGALHGRRAGVHVAAQPHPPVAALAAPRLSQERDGRVRLAWDEPRAGTVKILRTARPLAAAPGDRLSARRRPRRSRATGSTRSAPTRRSTSPRRRWGSATTRR